MKEEQGIGDIWATASGYAQRYVLSLLLALGVLGVLVLLWSMARFGGIEDVLAERNQALRNQQNQIAELEKHIQTLREQQQWASSSTELGAAGILHSVNAHSAKALAAIDAALAKVDSSALGAELGRPELESKAQQARAFGVESPDGKEGVSGEGKTQTGKPQAGSKSTTGGVFGSAQQKVQSVLLWFADVRQFGWQRVKNWGKEFFYELVRVRPLASVDAAQLAPAQAYIAKQQLRQALLGARLAVLARRPDMADADLQSAESLAELLLGSDKNKTKPLGVLPLLAQARQILAQSKPFFDKANAADLPLNPALLPERPQSSATSNVTSGATSTATPSTAAKPEMLDKLADPGLLVPKPKD